MVRRRPTPDLGETAARGRVPESRLPRVTICCPDCDVTWRGSTEDACWSCGALGRAVEAIAPQVRVS